MEWTGSDMPTLGKKSLFFLVALGLALMIAGLCLSAKELIIMAAAPIGLVFVFLLPSYPQILFPMIFITSALDVTGQIVETRFFEIPLTSFHLCLAALFFFSAINLLLVRRRQFPITGIEVPLFALLTIIGFSLIYTPNLEVGAVDFIRLFFLVALFFLTVMLIDTPRNVSMVVIAAIICTALGAGFGIFQTATEGYYLPATFVQRMGARTFRAAGTFHNPNTFGAFLMVGIILAFSLLVNLKLSWGKRIGLFIALGLLTSGLIVTFSRANWLAVAAGMLAVLILGRKLKLILLMPVILAVCLYVLSFFVPLEIIMIRLTSIFTLMEAFHSMAQASSSSRVLYVVSAFWMFMDSPIFGIGYRGYPVLFEKYIHPDFPNWLNVQECHTLPATFLAELGLIGITIAGWLTFAILRIGLRSLRGFQDPYLKTVQIGLISLFIAFQVSLLFTADFYDNFFWLMTAMIFAVIRAADLPAASDLRVGS